LVFLHCLTTTKSHNMLIINFKCCNKLSMFGFRCIFLGFLKMSSKSMVYNLFKRYFSFMFDDFDVLSFALKHICLHCIMLNTKIGNRWCFESAYLVWSKFKRCLTCICTNTLTILFAISWTPIPTGNSVGNIHELNLG
jgi:hypothetical protein